MHNYVPNISIMREKRQYNQEILETNCLQQETDDVNYGILK